MQQELTSLEAGTEAVSRRDMGELSEVVFVDVIRLLDTGLSVIPFIPELHEKKRYSTAELGTSSEQSSIQFHKGLLS